MLKKRSGLKNEDDESDIETPPRKRAKLVATDNNNDNQEKNKSDICVTSGSQTSSNSNKSDESKTQSKNDIEVQTKHTVNKSCKQEKDRNVINAFEYFKQLQLSAAKLWTKTNISEDGKHIYPPHCYPNDCCDKPQLCQQGNKKQLMTHSFIHWVYTFEYQLQRDKVVMEIVKSLAANKKIVLLDFSQTLACRKSCNVSSESKCEVNRWLTLDIQSVAAQLESNRSRDGEDKSFVRVTGFGKVGDYDIKKAKELQSSNFIDSKFNGYIFRPYLKEFLLYVTKEFNVGIVGGGKYYTEVVEYWNQEWLLSSGNKISFLVDECLSHCNLMKQIRDKLFLQLKNGDNDDKNINKHTRGMLIEDVVHFYKDSCQVDSEVIKVGRNKMRPVPIPNICDSDVDTSIETTNDGENVSDKLILPSTLYVLDWTNEYKQDNCLQTLQNDILPYWQNDEYDKIDKNKLMKLIQYPRKEYILTENTELVEMSDFKQDNNQNICNYNIVASKIDLFNKYVCKNNDENCNPVKIPPPAEFLDSLLDDRIAHGIGDSFGRKLLVFGDFFINKIVPKLNENKKHVMFITCRGWCDRTVLENKEIAKGFSALKDIEYKYHFIDDITLKHKNQTILYKIKNMDIVKIIKFCVQHFNVILISEVAGNELLYTFLNDKILKTPAQQLQQKEQQNSNTKSTDKKTIDHTKKNNGRGHGIIGFASPWNWNQTFLHGYHTPLDKESFWGRVTNDIRRYTEGKFEALFFNMCTHTNFSFGDAFRHHNYNTKFFYPMPADIVNVMQFWFSKLKKKTEFIQIKNHLLLYKKYYDYQVFKLVHECQFGHGLLDIESLIEEGLLRILNAICDNCIKFTIDDLLKYDCTELLKSCNRGTRLQQSEVIKASGIDLTFNLGTAHRDRGIISQTYLYKEILVKKLGLNVRLDQEQFKQKKIIKDDRKRSTLQIESCSDTMGKLVKNLNFRHLVDYFGIQFVKCYLLTNSLSTKLDIKAKRHRLIHAEVKVDSELEHNLKQKEENYSSDSLTTVDNNTCTHQFEIKLNITPYIRLYEWYNKSVEDKVKNSGKEITCRIEIIDKKLKAIQDNNISRCANASNDNGKGEENDENQIEIDMSQFNFYCSECTNNETGADDDKIQIKSKSDYETVPKQTKCVHIFRSLMEYVEYTPKNSTAFGYPQYSGHIVEIFNWFGSDYVNSVVLSQFHPQ